jgi:hypothetical protein
VLVLQRARAAGREMHLGAHARFGNFLVNGGVVEVLSIVRMSLLTHNGVLVGIAIAGVG